jgi:hypothetical protein
MFLFERYWAFDVVCPLLSSLFVVVNGSLRLDKEAIILEVVKTGLIYPANKLTSVDEYLVPLLVTVSHLLLEISRSFKSLG